MEVFKTPTPATKIFVGYRGSVAHGMFVPSTDPNSIDDIDIMTVYIPPIQNYFGLVRQRDRGTVETKDGKWDVVSYELRKFVSLLVKGNPNVISMLWLPIEHTLFEATEFCTLRQNRNIFSAKTIYHAFVGYARAQLYKMTHLACQGYMGEKRKALVERHGYDTKNAAHLIRLMRMACEFLETNEFIVDRSGVDAEELLNIKRGSLSIERVGILADTLFLRASNLVAKSKLPEAPNTTEIEGLLVSLIKEHFE